MIFRLFDDVRLAFLRLPGAADFEPMPGRKIKGYTTLRNPMRWEREELARWNRTCDGIFAVTASQEQTQASREEEWGKGRLM